MSDIKIKKLCFVLASFPLLDLMGQPANAQIVFHTNFGHRICGCAHTKTQILVHVHPPEPKFVSNTDCENGIQD